MLKNIANKNIANRESDFSYDSQYSFYRFCKEYNEFEEISLDTKYNKMKTFTNFLTNLENLKLKNPKTQLKKERTMKNVNELYEKYYKMITLTKMITTLMSQVRLKKKN